jgi:hypothetical protein
VLGLEHYAGAGRPQLGLESVGDPHCQALLDQQALHLADDLVDLPWPDGSAGTIVCFARARVL